MDSGDQRRANAHKESLMMKAYVLGAGLMIGAAFSPLTADADDASDGYLVYNDMCATCHGKDMMNPGLAFDLRKFPTDDKARFVTSVNKGKGTGMPPWEGKLSAEEIDLLWAYVKSGG